jgi:hypothetical protein
MARRPAGKLVPINGKPTTAEKLRGWAKRKNSSGVDFTQVSAATLRAAISVTIANGGALMFGSAMGGSGLMLKLYMGEDSAREFAATAEEAEELLAGVIEMLESESEDTLQAYASGKA